MWTEEESQLLICTACATQYDETDRSKITSCPVCDDPRQFVPPSGQSFTTLAEMKGKYTNKWTQDEENENLSFVLTEPKFGIGERAFLIKTPHGNVLWDLIAYLDEETIEHIKSQGGLSAIVISHPHYYTTWPIWSRIFSCPVYTSRDDEFWLNRKSALSTSGARSNLLDGPVGSTQEILPGVTSIMCGGHFDGSLCLHWDDILFIADTFVTVPSALYHANRPPNTTSYAFMYSIPNMVPLPPAQISAIWRAVRPFDFHTTHGAFLGLTVRRVQQGEQQDVKRRVLESMKIQVKAEGWEVGDRGCEVLEEMWETPKI